MKSAAQLVSAQVEQALAHRNILPFGTRVRSEESTAFGIAGLDAAVGRGIPHGAITELVGPECSGRTTAALAAVVAFQNQDKVCAWVDASDALDPESAAANGVDLERLLWVRCGGSPETQAQPERLPMVGVRERGTLQESAARHTGGGSPHPRSEGRDMPEAIDKMLRAHGGLYDKEARRERKKIGTPGMPNRPLSAASPYREEQVNSDRLPPRRGQNLKLPPRHPEPLSRPAAQVPPKDVMPLTRNGGAGGKAARPSLCYALDQALRATDLLLQGGGFGAIVLDLGSTAPEVAWRIPLATWFRFRAVCDSSRTSLLVLTQHPCARSSAGLVVKLEAGMLQTDGPVMTGIAFRAATERSRFQHEQARVVSIRKPPQPQRELGVWTSRAAWAGRR